MMTALAVSTDTGRKYLVLGLSHANLDKLRADGLNGFIKIDQARLGRDIGIDVLITAGENEGELMRAFAEFIGPDTDLTISEKLKT